MLTLSLQTVDLWLWQFDESRPPIRSPHAKSREESAPDEDRRERLQSLLTPEEQQYAAGLGQSALRLRWIEARAGLRRILAAYLDGQIRIEHNGPVHSEARNRPNTRQPNPCPQTRPDAQPNVQPDAWQNTWPDTQPSAQPKQLQIERDPHGKPYLATQDGQPHALQFNLSHTSDWCAVVVAHQMAVGVDIEQPRAISARLWPRVLTPAERAQMATLPADEQAAAFLRSWTRKEALGKAEGRGVLPQLGRTETGLHRLDGLLSIPLRSSETESKTWFLRELPARSSTNPPTSPLVSPLLTGAIAASEPFQIVERDYGQL